MIFWLGGLGAFGATARLLYPVLLGGDSSALWPLWDAITE